MRMNESQQQAVVLKIKMVLVLPLFTLVVLQRALPIFLMVLKFFIALKRGKTKLLLGHSIPLKPQLQGGFLIQKDITSLAIIPNKNRINLRLKLTNQAHLCWAERCLPIAHRRIQHS